MDALAGSVGGGWSLATEQFAPCRASTDIACHLAIVGESVGLVSVTAAFKMEAMAAEEDEGEDEPAVAAKVSATDSAAISLPPKISPVSKKEGFDVAMASWTSCMFGYPARTREENVAWWWC